MIPPGANALSVVDVFSQIAVNGPASTANELEKTTTVSVLLAVLPVGLQPLGPTTSA
ncbi:MAG: hypothetical protein IPH89_01560 [Bacteroidetes bacterium]|nr:hypothetical protein [Bacteroidota bacterium]